MKQRRVVITGIGAVTPLGNTVSETWDNLVHGRSGVGLITHFDASEYPSQIAAELKGFDPTGVIDKKVIRRTDPFIQYGLVAVAEAMADSGLVIDESNADRVGVVFGSGIGGIKSWDENHLLLKERGPGRVSPFLIPMLIGNMAAGMVSIQIGAKGPSKSVQTACATSAHSAGDGLRLIQNNEADVVIVGGSEAPVQPLACAGFSSMKALSCRNDDPEHASRPFDQDRDGFVIAEGAAALVLEEYEHAKARGATIHAEMAGYGTTTDAYHMASPLPCGSGAAGAMKLAVADAGLNLSDIGYINAHATSTPAGDAAEVAAIRRMFVNGTPPPPVSSTKSMTGHMLGAAGAVELIVLVLAIRDGILPATTNLEHQDPECLLDCIPNEAREVQVQAALSNSFGFGGHNCALVVRSI